MFRIAKAKFSGAADSKTDEFEEVQETENEFGQSLRTRDNEDRDTKREHGSFSHHSDSLLRFAIKIGNDPRRIRSKRQDPRRSEFDHFHSI